MPTPVNTARQCLTQEAAQALDEAVAVARRRGHAQTTSIHAVSALLSLPSSALREACGRARNNAYSTRILFKALELCLGVSLDRLPSSPQRFDDPPVSNSLMAAIKRSQANQRRQPENFQFYQQQQQSSSTTISTVKVELRNLILSILDDPVVSRVFGEAGFRSCDIKLAILRPVHELFRYSRYKGPRMFFYNLTGDSDVGRRGFSFPFLGFLDGDENCRRIGEVLARNKGRNPLLVGVYAIDALRNFTEIIEGKKGGSVLPVELYGLSLVSIEGEISKFANGNCNEGFVKLRLEEVGRILEHCVGPGVVVNFGDLKALTGEDISVDAVSYVFRELASLLELHGAKVWLIGATTRYETYSKFMDRFPIDKDWDLQLLPITSPRASVGETCPKSSLMESFVPFGGFFSTPSDAPSPLSSSYQCVSRCHLCSEKCEQEVTALSKGGFTTSIADQYRSSLPSWLHMAEHSTNRGLDVMKAKDDSVVLSAKVAGLQRKWDNICQHLHYRQPSPKADPYYIGAQVPALVGFKVVEDRKENVDNHSSNATNASSTENGCKNINSCLSMDVQQIPTSEPSISFNVVSEAYNVNFQSKLCEKSLKMEDELVGLRSPCSLSGSSMGDSRTSPTSATSVTTDLGLGIYSASKSGEPEKCSNQTQKDLLQDFWGCFSTNVDVIAASMSNHPVLSSSCSCHDFNGKFDQRDFKKLCAALISRIGRQEEAVSVISQAIVRCRTRNEKRHGGSRGDIWFNFLGPDRFGKKRVAASLAEMLCGSRENFICVDLSLQVGMICTNTISDLEEMNCYDVKFRGKTVVDYIAEILSKKPLSVIFLENIDKADLLAQNSLYRAVKTGKFLDSHGREVGNSNAIFVTSSRFTNKSENFPSERETTNYCEENILTVKGCQFQMLIGFELGDDVASHKSRVSDIARKGNSVSIFENKRKLIGTNETMEQHEPLDMAKRAHRASNMILDLNLPAEDGETHITADYGNSDSNSISDNSKAWLEDFFAQVDETVVFKPFDFDALAEKILKKISECFHNIVGSECALEIDSKVMEQILAAICLSDNKRVDNWIERVLSSGFVEAQKRYSLNACSVVKLVTCGGLSPQEQAAEVFLPARIIMN